MKFTTAKLDHVKKVFSKKFIKYNNVINVMSLAMATNQNLVLYGKGGHAKSDMSLAFMQALGITPFIKSLGKGTGIEELFGGIKMKEFDETGRMDYLVENSFMNHEFVIFEEAFDAPLQVLEQLKDILSSGYFRNGNQVFKVKTKFIVVCTNRSKEELADNDSLKALMERFQLELNVKWDSYLAEDYNEMFEVVLGERMEEFSTLIEAANASTFISPRTAIHAAAVWKLSGISGLKYVQGFTHGLVDALEEKAGALAQIALNKSRMKQLEKFVDKAETIVNKYHNAKPIKLLQGAKYYKDLITTLNDIPCQDDLLPRLNSLKTHLDDRIRAFEKGAYSKVQRCKTFLALDEVYKIYGIDTLPASPLDF